MSLLDVGNLDILHQADWWDVYKAEHMVETDRVVERWNMAFLGLTSSILHVR